VRLMPNHPIIGYVEMTESSGYGHFMRMRNLMSQFQMSGYSHVYLAVNTDRNLKTFWCGDKPMIRIPKGRFKFQWEDFLNKVSQISSAHQRLPLILIDLPQLSAQKLKWMDRFHLPYILFHDSNLSPYQNPIVVNPNFAAEKLEYSSVNRNTRFLLGSPYWINPPSSRGPFLNPVEPVSQVKKILVTMGGSDPGQLTEKVLEVLSDKSFNHVEVSVVIGSYFKDRINVWKKKRGPSLSKRIQWHYDVKRLTPLLKGLDLAILSGGISKYEIAEVGIPMIVLSQNREQDRVMQQFQKTGACQYLGLGKEVSKKIIKKKYVALSGDFNKRKLMSKVQRKIIDGRGYQRLCHEIDHWLRGYGSDVKENRQRDRMKRNISDVHLRWANKKDARQLWVMRNELGTRKASFTSQRIPWDEHKQWFQKLLMDSKSRVWLIENKLGESLGQIRFSLRAQGRSEIHIALTHMARKQGYGTKALDQAINYCFHVFAIDKIVARVKCSNVGSVAFFKKCGFEPSSFDLVSNHPIVLMEIKKKIFLKPRGNKKKYELIKTFTQAR